jgi:hypothetical protein
VKDLGLVTLSEVKDLGLVTLSAAKGLMRFFELKLSE